MLAIDCLEIFKALSNEKRLEILLWLKEPHRYFSCAEGMDFEKHGVCVGYIQKRSGLTQSTISEYLTILKKAGLVESVRIGQWTYYKRNEKVFKELSRIIKTNI